MSRSRSNTGVREYVDNIFATAVKNTSRKALMNKLNEKEANQREQNTLKIRRLADSFIRDGIKERNELSKLQKDLLSTGSASFSLSSRSKSAPTNSRSKSASKTSRSKKGGKRRYTKKRRSTK
jgi:hypothetical protein